jgi:zinc and cadmium transporter
MNDFLIMVIFSLIGGIVSLIGGFILLRSKKSADKLALYATPFAGGALLSAVFLDLLKEGIDVDGADNVLMATLIGIVIFFFAEGFLHWFHHHHDHKDGSDPKKTLIILGDTVHNALDGVAIAAAFLISIPTGIVTTIAVAAHEIPQEIGDFGLLLSKGMSRRKVLLVNVFSALATTAAAIITYVIGNAEILPLGFILGISAGFLLYIAISDVIPSIHADRNNKKLFDLKALLFLLGVLTVGLITTFAHTYIDNGHSHQEESSIQTHHDDEDHSHSE